MPSHLAFSSLVSFKPCSLALLRVSCSRTAPAPSPIAISDTSSGSIGYTPKLAMPVGQNHTHVMFSLDTSLARATLVMLPTLDHYVKLIYPSKF